MGNETAAICNHCGYRSEEHPGGSRSLRICPGCKTTPRQRSFKTLFTDVLEPEVFVRGGWKDALLLSPGKTERTLLGKRFAHCTLSSLHAVHKGYVVADIVDLAPFAGRSFDYAQACNVLDYVPEMPRAIASVHRVLRPHGLFVFLIPEGRLMPGNAEIAVSIRESVRGSYWPEKDTVPEVTIGRDRLRNVLRETGFEAREVLLIEPLSAVHNTWWLCRKL